jgi:hypothetical protein
MIPLPQCCPHGLWDSYAGFGTVSFMQSKPHIAIFADVRGKVWINFPAGATDKNERIGHDTQKNTRS